jgi:hypothetical protein
MARSILILALAAFFLFALHLAAALIDATTIYFFYDLKPRVIAAEPPTFPRVSLYVARAGISPSARGGESMAAVLALADGR